MKNCLIIPLLLFFLVFGCNPFKQSKNPPVPENGKKSLLPEHRKNEIMFLFKDSKFKKQWVETFDDFFKKEYPELKIQKRICGNCLELGELWIAEGLDTLINQIIDAHGNRISVSNSRTSAVTGDGGAVISLNFLGSIFDELDRVNSGIASLSFEKEGFKGDDISVAILDTGVDLEHFPNNFLWINEDLNSCYKSEKNGWNFVDNSSNINDGTNSKHGTLVNAYILEQFLEKKQNYPILLNVKVLDNCNSGNLFDLVCGTLYAKEKGAKIINTSLGFYDNSGYDFIPGGKHPVLQSLVKDHLLPKGILLVTAAGNILSEGNSRDLVENKFYPAFLSETSSEVINNVFTVTTINEKLNSVSPRQNFSNFHVDAGVIADKEFGDSYRFGFPFTHEIVEQEPISGSSFAAAIMTGKIGATFQPDMPDKIRISPKSRWLEAIRPIGVLVNTNADPNLEDKIKNSMYSRRVE